MSPFGGSAADPAWSAVDLRAFLAADTDCSTPQVAFRLAYELPRVARVAVGTSNPAHLRELAAAVALSVSDTAISRYRALILNAADQR
jgi:pyridoxine 4-dehydrogenase